MANDYAVENLSQIKNILNQDIASAETTTHADKQGTADTHAKAEGHTEAKNDVFSQVFKGLGDHSGFYIGNIHICDLPVIIVDGGLKIYSSPQSMTEAGLYTKTLHGHGPIVRTSDGGAPALDMSVTNLVVFQWIAMLVVMFLFGAASRKYKKNPDKAPSGFQNLAETFIEFIRNDMVRPNMPLKTADALLPYFTALFFFILTMNMLGLLPGGHTATGAIPVTLALALTAFFVINGVAIKVSGIGAWFKHLLGGAPWYFFPIMIPVELIGMFVKPFALTVRLFANMSAGHIILFSLLGLLFYFKNLFISPAIVGFSVFIYMLETLVAFIQAFIFTMLTAIFVGLAIGDHAHEEHEHSH